MLVTGRDKRNETHLRYIQSSHTNSMHRECIQADVLAVVGAADAIICSQVFFDKSNFHMSPSYQDGDDGGDEGD